MSDKKYSVLMSVYQKEKPTYLKISIKSMLNQTLPPNEIVIVKDGPIPKELNDVILEYKFNFPNIINCITLKENVGLGLALNEGLKKCKNEIIARMDTDDISVPQRCELQFKEFLRDNELDIVGSSIDEFYEDPQKIVSSRVVPLTHIEIVKSSRRKNPFNHPTVMYRKSVVLKNGGYNNYRRNQDLDLFVRMLNNDSKAKNIKQSLVLFRANRDNLKRRKSWEKCSSYVRMIYHFWKKGYSSTTDLLFVTASQFFIFVSPTWLLEWVSNNYLRESAVK